MFVTVLTAEINHEHRDAAVKSIAAVLWLGVWIPAFRSYVLPPPSGYTMGWHVLARRRYPVTRRTVS